MAYLEKGVPEVGWTWVLVSSTSPLIGLASVAVILPQHFVLNIPGVWKF